MDELFLHFLWNYQKFNQRPIYLESGEKISVVKTGYHNHNAGPDFIEALLIIDEIEWAGSVEIHYHASDWNRHAHQTDPAYENVILHVVWENDKEVTYNNQAKIPTLVLSKYVDNSLTQEYRAYINQPKKILCDSFLTKASSLQKTFMLDHALMDRLEMKSLKVMDIHSKVNGDWDETAYQMLGRNFGFSVNKEPFEELTTILPYKYIIKHHDHPQQVHALIFGTAGFLEDIVDDYSEKLKKEYEFLRTKYQLNNQLVRQNWRFSRMRPSNFPTVRLAQFAAFLISNKRLFSFFTDTTSTSEKLKKLNIQPDNYWQEHYDFGKKLENGTNNFGRFSAENLIINTSVPLLTAYSKHIGDEAYIMLAIDQLRAIKGEQNNITKQWSELGLKPEDAADSQALIQQYNEFCLKKRCLHCNIGIAILNQK